MRELTEEEIQLRADKLRKAFIAMQDVNKAQEMLVHSDTIPDGFVPITFDRVAEGYDV